MRCACPLLACIGLPNVGLANVDFANILHDVGAPTSGVGFTLTGHRGLMGGAAPARVRDRPTWLISRAHARSSRLLNEAFESHGSGLRPYHYRLLSALEESGPHRAGRTRPDRRHQSQRRRRDPQRTRRSWPDRTDHRPAESAAQYRDDDRRRCPALRRTRAGRLRRTRKADGPAIADAAGRVPQTDRHDHRRVVSAATIRSHRLTRGSGGRMGVSGCTRRGRRR